MSDSVRTIDWYFDFISPFAWLQAEDLAHLPVDVNIRCKPVLFAGLLQAWGQLGPAEIAGKRTFTYEFIVWKAQKLGLTAGLPPAHPFNPLPLLRLSALLGSSLPTVLRLCRFVWSEGRSADDRADWAALTRELGVADPDAPMNDAGAKQIVRDNGAAAIACGVFGVPTAVVDGHLFWGADATPMLLDYLRGAPVFESEQMQRARAMPIGKARAGKLGG